MTTRLTLAAGLLALLLAGPTRADGLTVTGTVKDAAGKPVAGAEVASFWIAQGDAMNAHEGAKTDENGKFNLKANHFSRPVSLLVLDKDRKTGGVFTLGKDTKDKEATVTLGPVVRVKGEFFCKEMNFKPKWTNVYMMTADGARFLQSSSDKGEFSFLVPAGTYKFHGYGRDIKDVKQDLIARADAPLLDMKTLDVPATEIARHKGKAPPKWTVTDARGVKKDVSLADYKGKWVLVDFYTHWCGPCVARSLPNLIELYEDHKDHRDKFEVLAFHVKYATDFKDYDEKIKDAKAKYWGGKELPFPILLDATEDTIKAFGVRAFPTSILIDPDGKLVGEVDEEELVKKLPPVSAEARLAKLPRLMDKQISLGISDTPLKQSLDFLARSARIDIRLDEAALTAAGVSAGDKVPLKMAGSVSLRCWLNLILDAHNLAYKTDDKGLVVTAKNPKADRPELTEAQKTIHKRIEERLGEKKDFTFKDAKLEDVAQFFEQMTTENFVLDPAARKAGKLDPAAKVTGSSSKDVPLREGLQKLLDPLGLTVAVRDEVVVILPKAK